MRANRNMDVLENHIEQLSVGERILFMLSSWALLFYSTFVTMKVWQWFMVPIGLPQIGFFAMMGVSLVIQYLTTNMNMATKEIGSVLEWVLGRTFYTSFVFFQAWLITLFL